MDNTALMISNDLIQLHYLLINYSEIHQFASGVACNLESNSSFESLTGNGNSEALNFNRT